MNKPAVLALATAAIGGLGVYLLLRADPERMQAGGPPPAAHAPDAGNAAGPRATPPEPGAAARSGIARDVQPPAPRLGSDEEHQARQRRQAGEFLKRYADPEQRAAIVEAERDAVRRSTAGFEQRYDLTPGQYEKLVQLLAEEGIEKRLTTARCITDAGCITPVLDDAVFGARDQDIRDLIGDEGFGELRAFPAAEAERHVVAGLQSRLAPGLALTATQSDDLTRALYDERARLRRQSHARQEHLEVWALAGSAAPRLEYADTLATPELMYQSGERYVQALRDRAATQLTGEQLVAFNRMYDELLVSFHEALRAGTIP